MEPDRVEALLRSNRPEPRPGFRDELAQELFPARRPSRLPRPLLVGAATATAMAAGAVAMSMVGAGPLASSNGDVEATDNCRTVTVKRRQRVPYVVQSSNGRTRIAYRYKMKQRQVRRCP